MTQTDTIKALIACIVPEPARLSFMTTHDAGRACLVIQTIPANQSRIIGRQGATVTALKLIFEAMTDGTDQPWTLHLLEPDPTLPATAEPAGKGVESIGQMFEHLGRSHKLEAARAGFVTIDFDDETPGTEAIAIETVIKAACLGLKKSVFINSAALAAA